MYVRLIPFLALVPAMIGVAGLYPGVLLNPIDEFRRLSIAIFFGMSLVVVGTFLVKESNLFSRSVFLLALPLAVGLATGGRWLVRRCCAGASWWGLSAVLIGPASSLASVVSAVEARPSSGIRFVRVVEADPSSLPFDLDPEVIRQRIPYAVVILPAAVSAEWILQVERLAWQCEKFFVIPQSKSLSWSWTTARDCSGFTGLEVRRELLRMRSRIAKRIIDSLAALLGGILIAPWIALIAAIVKLTSSGPAFYGQARVGQDGRTFYAWKFRTMVQNADEVLQHYLDSNSGLLTEWQENHKLKDDPRVTPIGQFLRRTSLDELPQIWNVIRGEMSLVGPRPIVREEIDKYSAYFYLYCKVKPGITGLWQVSGRSNTTYGQRVAMDVHYVRNWSLWMDIYLLWKTLSVVLRKQGAY
jgi:Undecaprenyl-phosphate galactose phosphotransferase WbaP